MNKERLTVLLFEDNPPDADLVSEMLAEVRANPFHLECVDTLAAGLERLARDEVDVILLDLSLPDCHGLDTFRRVHQHAPDRPVVVLSGLNDEEVAAQAVYEGAQDYLVKGQVDGNLLVRCMRYAIERQRADREREELLVREQEARARAERIAAEHTAVLGQIADGVVICDPNGNVTFVNEAARRLVDLDEGSELLGTPVATFVEALHLTTVDGEPYPTEEFALTRAVKGDEAVIGELARIRRPDRSEVVVQSSAIPVVAEDGTRLGTVLTMHDITARHDLERQKDEFLTSISHDLRTPVAAIKVSIGVVLANEPAGIPEPIHRLFVNIDLAADRMTQLVGDLLELTRLQAGRVQLHRQHTDLRDLVERVAREVEPLAQSRDQRVEVDLPRCPVVGYVDAERLERVLLNLAGNAHKYGRTGGLIRLVLEEHDGEIGLAVVDDGPGIPFSEQQRIFERFYRSESDAVRKHQGSGLGLPIARGLVELHGGRLWVESRPGHGATFRVALPAMVDPSAEGSEQ